jgi:hypothetical protein
MMIRRLAAVTTVQRRQLLNTQRREFQRDYVLRYGLPLGRYYFTLDTLGEVRKALRKLPLLGTTRNLNAMDDRPRASRPCPSFFRGSRGTLA